ncbi:hypothetical protein BAU15_07190 [Enterococcus sp. JM4C]|uniref:hypothetical protein n=1 Tax=Candidatus Enterococcus huntleyi TaxID=1857217 RepID=UPI00137A6EC4|nr:hypothetical protein [Enterococcus sp. JM4C]KAF1297492.1 hypothetical protein BAU15_07190 [Enterococcus sp. JM4C]
MTRNRTKKEFSEYNDYHDRGFLKWVTAFALDELASSIEKNHAEATKNIPLLPRMSLEEINDVLTLAFLKTKAVSIQLNKRDEFGRPLESIEGFFSGQFQEESLLIDETAIFWEDIRHIQLIETKKWSDFDVFESDEANNYQEPDVDQEWLEEG